MGKFLPPRESNYISSQKILPNLEMDDDQTPYETQNSPPRTKQFYLLNHSGTHDRDIITHQERKLPRSHSSLKRAINTYDPGALHPTDQHQVYVEQLRESQQSQAEKVREALRKAAMDKVHFNRRLQAFKKSQNSFVKTNIKHVKSPVYSQYEQYQKVSQAQPPTAKSRATPKRRGRHFDSQFLIEGHGSANAVVGSYEGSPVRQIDEMVKQREIRKEI